MLDILGEFNINCHVISRKQNGLYKGCILDWQFFDGEGARRDINTTFFQQQGSEYQQWGDTVYTSPLASPLIKGSINQTQSPNILRLFGVMSFGWLYPPANEKVPMPFTQNTNRVFIPYDEELTADYNLTIQLRREDGIILSDPTFITYSTYVIGLVGSLPEWARIITFNLINSSSQIAFRNFYDSMMILGYGLGWAIGGGLGIPRQTPTPTLPKDIFRAYTPLQMEF